MKKLISWNVNGLRACVEKGFLGFFQEVDADIFCLQETKLQEQIRQTADVFAVDMLLAKFVQGVPVAGILGGICNPVYYRRILNYVQLKYQKRYLLQKREG